MQQNGSQHESVPVDQESGTDATDDERASELQAPVGSDAEAPEPEEGVSVEDDLWALRARLAHAGDADQPRETPPAPSWS